MSSEGRFRIRSLNRVLFAVIAALLVDKAHGQALSVQPVNIVFPTGQRATTVTVTNQGKEETAIQIRPFAWSQSDGTDMLAATEEVVASPPIATIAPGATQVVRIILRHGSEAQEGTFRLLVDQIPPAAQPGIVHVVFRVSIPIFVQPSARALAQVAFHVEQKDGKSFLVGSNKGSRHEVIRDLTLSTADGRKLKQGTSASPYILAGAVRRWPIEPEEPRLMPGEPLKLTARLSTGGIEQQVQVVAEP